MPDLSTKILTKIHEELRGLRSDVHVTNERLSSLDTKVEATNGRLASLETKVEVTNARLGIIEHTLVDFGTQVVFAGRLIENVEQRHDRELGELRTRVPKLETPKPKR